jgi:hypothetical protein
MRAHVTFLLASSGVGLLLATAYAASPLSAWMLLAAPLLIVVLSRGLPAAERRALILILAVAFSARAAFVAAMFLADIPHLNDLSIGGLAGDEAYYLSRAIRGRDILLGFSHGNYDYFVATDEYGRTSYLSLLTWLQVVFGPTPYSMRLLNAALFVAGAGMLYRVVRGAFGSGAALLGLVALLFLPSLFVSSVSLLKEPLYFLVSSTLLCSVIQMIRRPNLRERIGLIVLAGAALWLLDDLRRGALVLAGAGLAAGVLVRITFIARWRLATMAVIAGLALAVVLAQPALRARGVDAIESTARTHAGHVFTVGHAYKLMDEGFYITPQSPSDWDLALTEPQAARFVVRAMASFLLTPLPWEVRTISELAFLPEHMAWYALLALLPLGIVTGWRRDPLTTSMLIGYALPTAAVVALTNGNVGTLLRLRGLVTPFLLWIGVLGMIAILEALTTPAGPVPDGDVRASQKGAVA